MHLATWYIDFGILVPPLFELQEFVQIRQGQKEPIREAGNHMMRSQKTQDTDHSFYEILPISF